MQQRSVSLKINKIDKSLAWLIKEKRKNSNKQNQKWKRSYNEHYRNTNDYYKNTMKGYKPPNSIT